MTPSARPAKLSTLRARCLIAAGAVLGVLAAPGSAAATFGLPPAGPWPTMVAAADNPLPRAGLANNGVSATADARLRIWLGARRNITVLTRSVGTRTYLHGRLFNNNNEAIANAGVMIAREVIDDPGWEAVRLAPTSRHGYFHVRVPKGPSRRFAAIYWPHAVSTVPIYSRRVLLRSSARVTLKVRRGRGGIVRFHGRVSGSTIPPGGLLVNVQVANRGRWPSVRTVHTRPTGLYFGRYRFSGRRPSGFVVRAQVLRQTGWRLFTASSRRIRVHPR